MAQWCFLCRSSSSAELLQPITAILSSTYVNIRRVLLWILILLFIRHQNTQHSSVLMETQRDGTTCVIVGANVPLGWPLISGGGLQSLLKGWRSSTAMTVVETEPDMLMSWSQTTYPPPSGCFLEVSSTSATLLVLPPMGNKLQSQVKMHAVDCTILINFKLAVCILPLVNSQTKTS